MWRSPHAVSATRTHLADDVDEADPDLEHEPGQQDHATDADDADQRAADLRHPECRQGDTSEREGEAQRLGEGVSCRSADDPPGSDRRHQLGEQMERGEDRAGHEVPGAVSCTIQAMPRYIQPAPKRNPMSMR